MLYIKNLIVIGHNTLFSRRNFPFFIQSVLDLCKNAKWVFSSYLVPGMMPRLAPACFPKSGKNTGLCSYKIDLMKRVFTKSVLSKNIVLNIEIVIVKFIESLLCLSATSKFIVGFPSLGWRWGAWFGLFIYRSKSQKPFLCERRQDLLQAS